MSEHVIPLRDLGKDIVCRDIVKNSTEEVHSDSHRKTFVANRTRSPFICVDAWTTKEGDLVIEIRNTKG
ncbi:unnamed protein product [marine sediment metagenome]|uniref:Uncharacterized protein n=1 Tax=marine sediment metagenome TaxID=412755 RepID=X1B2R4_9ZZZZ